MHHKLDIHPIPTDVLYINELSLLEKHSTKQNRIWTKLSPERQSQMAVPSRMTMWGSMCRWIWMPTLLCGNYIRCIAHSAIQQRKMNPPIVPCRKSYLATGNLRSSVDSKKPRGHCAERRWRCAAQQSGHRTCKANREVSGRYRGYCRVLSVWWDSGTKRSFLAISAAQIFIFSNRFITSPKIYFYSTNCTSCEHKKRVLYWSHQKNIGGVPYAPS